MSLAKLTSSRTAQFEHDGVICLRGVLSGEHIDGLRSATQRQVDALGCSATGYDLQSIAQQVWSTKHAVETGNADRFDLSDLPNLVVGDKDARPLVETEEDSEAGMFFYDVAGWKRHDEIRSVALDSDLPELIANLLRSSYLNFWEDTTFIKAPHTKQKTAFHQDLAYFQIEGEKCVIVWIPLDPANRENGVTRYIKGSHTWPSTYAPNVFFAQTPVSGSPHKRLPDIEANEDSYDIIEYDVQPGDVIIHHVRTIHGAGGNLTDKPRRAISFRYCGDDVRYFDRPGAIPQVGVTHSLARGDALTCADYPLVWPRAWPGIQLSPMHASANAAGQ